MKNPITQFVLVLIAFVALTFLMSYTKPAADEPKQYTILFANGTAQTMADKLSVQVNQKITEGWHPQGGVAQSGGTLMQAMVK
jgi:hypothetical protein